MVRSTSCPGETHCVALLEALLFITILFKCIHNDGLFKGLDARSPGEEAWSFRAFRLNGGVWWPRRGRNTRYMLVRVVP
jgi:hypothetical protein